MRARAVRFVLFPAGVAMLLALGITLPAVGGTTGGIGGRVVDSTTRAPISGARVDMSAPSGSAGTVTDSRGLYTFLSLAPDTYELRVTHDGYVPSVEYGVTIQADVQLRLDVLLVASAKLIGQFSITARAGLVSPGQTINVYSVYPAKAEASRPLSGPGGVDQAYSALAAVPGIYVPQGQQGWYQPIYIRGGDQDQIGYELDGVPVNRSYDNAPESLSDESRPARAASLHGRRDRKLRRTRHQRLHQSGHQDGIPHALRIDGIRIRHAHDLSKRLVRVWWRFTRRAADLLRRRCALRGRTTAMPTSSTGRVWYQSGFFFPSFQFTATGQGPSICPGSPSAHRRPATRRRSSTCTTPFRTRTTPASDDLQFLHIQSDLHTFTYGSFNDFGAQSTFGTTFAYPDQFIYTGQVFAPLSINNVSPYLYPNTPDANRSLSEQVSGDRRAVADNVFDLTKLQYQHNIGTRAYVRVLGFSTYSLWDIEDPIPVPSTLQYILPEITFGGVVSFADQLSDKNLLTVSGSYASSREYRYSSGFDFLLGGGFTNSGAIGGNFLGSVLIGSYTDGKHCYDQASGAYTSCFGSASQATLNVNDGIFDPFTTASSGPAVTNGARWIATENGLGGLINQVSPILTAGAISDRIRPDDKLTLDVGVRVESYVDRLVNEANGYPARPFWFNAFNHEFCVASANLYAFSNEPLIPRPARRVRARRAATRSNLGLSSDQHRIELRRRAAIGRNLPALGRLHAACIVRHLCPTSERVVGTIRHRAARHRNRRWPTSSCRTASPRRSMT